MDKTEWLHKYKPAAPARIHHLAAAVAWMLVGSILVGVGVYWARGSGHSLLYIAAASGAGLFKGRFVLDKTARRTVRRIEERGDGRCLGGFFSYKSWILVAVMAAAGRILRSGIVSTFIVALIYAAVGTALAYSSRLFWNAYAARRKSTG